MIRDNDYSPLGQLQRFARYKTHGGYSWCAVTEDGELLCVSCVRDNYREVYRATRNPRDTSCSRDWRVMGLANSGEADVAEQCCNCNKVLWGIEE